MLDCHLIFAQNSQRREDSVCCQQVWGPGAHKHHFVGQVQGGEVNLDLLFQPAVSGAVTYRLLQLQSNV